MGDAEPVERGREVGDRHVDRADARAAVEAPRVAELAVERPGEEALDRTDAAEHGARIAARRAPQVGRPVGAITRTRRRGWVALTARPPQTHWPPRTARSVGHGRGPRVAIQ